MTADSASEGTSRNQFNGLVMVHGYLQRLQVYGKARTLQGPADVPLPSTRSATLFEITNPIARDFTAGSRLADGQLENLLAAVEEIRSVVDGCLPRPDDDLARQVAVTTASLYAEKHITEGVIRLGDLFDPVVADRYRQQLLPARNNARYAEAMVSCTIDGTALDEQQTTRLRRWYANTTANAPRVPADLDLVAGLLRGTSGR